MKKLTLLFALGAMVLNSCTKELPSTDISSVSTERKTILFKFGSTTCGSCIAQETPMKQHLNANKYKIYGISVLQDYVCTTPINYQYNYSGIPAYTEGTAGVLDTTGSLSAVKTSSSALVDTKASIGIGGKYSISGNTVTFSLKSVLFDNLSGNYNVAVYVLENKCDTLDNGQAASGGPRDHVYRGAAMNKVWGTQLITGSANKKDVIETVMTYNLGTQYMNYEEIENLEFIAVIYRVENNRGVEIMNCNKVVE